jgi:uncharacterized repeat protein (TIGR02543 family)
MNTYATINSRKRITAIAVGIVLLSLLGQSAGNAYQYPALTSHHKFRIFVSHKSAVKAPVVAALRALPAKASPLANLDPATVVLVPITPVLASGSTTITEGDLTPTFTPSYSIPSTITLPRSPVCDVIEAPGVTHLGAGTFHADCSFASPALPASISYDDTGAGITYVYTFTYPQVTITVNAAATHNVLFDDGFGNIVATEPFVNGASVVAPADPTHAGYTFNGWSETLYGSAVSFPYTAASFADVTLHALWTLIPTAPTAWTLTANNASYTIGGSMPTLSSVANPSGAISGSASCGVYAVADSGYATPLAWHSLPAGAYVIRCTGTPATGYAVATLVNGSLTVSNPSPTPPTNYISHTVSYNLSGGNGAVPASINAAEGAGYTVASGFGLSKEGYTFGGWTDGSHVFAASSLQFMGTSDIVLTAIWVSTASGDGSGAQPIVLPKTPVTPPVVQTFTNHAVASNLVANFAKIVDSTFKSTVVPVQHDAGTSIRLTDGVQASLVDQLNLLVTPVGVQVTAVKGWTGRISFPVVATQSGSEVELFIGVEEDPASVLTPSFNLLNPKQAKVTWTANNSQVELNNIYLGNQLACTSTKTSCILPITSIANFKSTLKIESVGHQATYSTKVSPAYALKSLVSAGIVHFNVGSAELTNSAKKTLASLVKTLKALGVTTVNLNGHADATGLDAVNKQLSIARAAAVKTYLAKALPKLKFNGKGFSSSVPAKSNATASGRSDNRRVEVLVG